MALPLVVGGFVLFLSIFNSALQGWAEESRGLPDSQDALQLAQVLRRAWLPRGVSVGAVLDAGALDEAEARPGYLDDVCPQCREASARVIAKSDVWTFGAPPRGEARCAYLAVAVRFDLARCEPAVILVCLGGSG